MGPPGTPAASSMALHSALLRASSRSAIRALSRWRWRTGRCCWQSRGPAPSRVPQQGRQRGKLAVVAHREDQMAIPGGVDVVGDDIGVAVAKASGRLTGGEIVHRLVGQHRHRHVEQGQIDLLPLPGSLAVAQGRLDADGGVEAGEDVDERHPTLTGPPPGSRPAGR